MIGKITIIIMHVRITMPICYVEVLEQTDVGVLEQTAYVIVEKRTLLAILDFAVFKRVEHAYLIPIMSTRKDMSLSCPDNMHISPIIY